MLLSCRDDHVTSEKTIMLSGTHAGYDFNLNMHVRCEWEIVLMHISLDFRAI